MQHKLQATAKLVNNWKYIVMHLQNYAEDRSNKSTDREKAKGILKKILEYKLVWFMHFLKDVLNEVAKVSLIFQREDVNVPTAAAKIQSAKLSLQNMKEKPGVNLCKFEDEVNENKYRKHTLHHVVTADSLSTQRRRIIQSLCDCMDSRFENFCKEPIYLSCKIFDHKNWPDDHESLVNYGLQELRVINDHYQSVLENCNCDIEAAFSEWAELKLYVKDKSKFIGKDPLCVWQRVGQEDAERQEYLNILKVVHLTSVYPLANAACERGFSTMKRIKSDWRCSYQMVQWIF